MTRYDHDEARVEGTKWWLWGLILLIITMVILGACNYWLKPMWVSMDRKVTKESHQYVEGKQGMLLQWVEKYEELSAEVAKYEKAPGDNTSIIEGLKAQQASMLSRIKREAQMLPNEDEVPASVAEFLKRHQ